MRYRLRWLAAGLVMLLLLGALLPAVAAGAEVPALTEGQAITMLRSYGIVRGVPGGALLLDQKLTRAQAAALFVRSRGAEGMARMLDQMVPFTDARGHWAAGEIALAERLGLMRGDGDGRFRPEDDITYAEVLTVLLRMVEREPAGAWDPAAVISASARAGFAPAGMNPMVPAVRGKIFWALATAVSRVPLPSGQTVLQKYVDDAPPRIIPDRSSITTKEETATISGTAPEAVAIAIGGNPAALDVNTGRFEGTVKLPLGQSRIAIEATDAAGNKATGTVAAERKVNIARMEIRGAAVMRAGTAQKLTVTAADPRGQAVPLEDVKAELTGDVAAFDLATTTLTAGSRTGPGTLTLRHEGVTATFAFEVTDVSRRARRLAITQINGGKEPVLGREATVQVQVVDAEGQPVTDDYWRSIFLSAAGAAGITVMDPMGTTSKGAVTLRITSVVEGPFTLRAASPSLADAFADLRFVTPTRIVLAALPASLPPDGTSQGAIGAYLRDENGQAAANTSGSDIRLMLTATGGDGALVKPDLVIRQGYSDSAADDATFRAGLQSVPATLSGRIVSAHGYSVLPAAISAGQLPGVRLAVSYQPGVQSPGSDTVFEVRVLDTQNQLVTSGSYAFQLAVSTSNGEQAVAGLPAGVLLTFPDQAYRPAGTPGTDAGAVIGRTYQGRAQLRLRYDKSGIVTLTPVLTGLSYQAYHPASGFGPAAQSAGMTTQSFSITFAGEPRSVRLTADSALGNGLAAGAVGPGAALRLRAQVVDAAGVPIPGYSGIIRLERSSGPGVTAAAGDWQRPSVNGAAEFILQASSTAGTDVYRAVASGLVSPGVAVSVRAGAPATPAVAAVRGVREGDPSPVTGYVSPEAAYLDIQLHPQASPVSGESSHWVLVKVFRKGEPLPLYAALVDLKADPPIIRVAKSTLAPGRTVYEVTVHNGYAESARSVDGGLSEALNAVYQDSYGISAAYFDAGSGRLVLRTANLEAGGTVNPSALFIGKGVNILPLIDPTIRVILVSPTVVILELGGLASAVLPDLYHGEVVVKGAAGWYRSSDGARVARAVTGAPMTPAAVITHALLDSAGRRLYLHGAGLGHGSLDLAKLRLVRGESGSDLRPGHDQILSSADGQIVLSLSEETLSAINAMTGPATRLEAAAGWLKLTYDGASYQAASLSGPDRLLYIRAVVTSVQYDRSARQLTVRGAGYTGAGLDPAKLIFRASGTTETWRPGAGTAGQGDDAMLSLVLDAEDAAAFESRFGGRTVFMNTAAGWLTDSAGRPAAAIPLDSILFSVPAR